MKPSRGAFCIVAVLALAVGCSADGETPSETAAATEPAQPVSVGDPPSDVERKAWDRVTLDLHDAQGRVGWADFWQLRKGGVTLFEIAPKGFNNVPLLLRRGTCRRHAATAWSRLDLWNEAEWSIAELRGSTWAVDVHGGDPGVVTACGSHSGDRLLRMTARTAPDQGARRRRNGGIVVTGGGGTVELQPDAGGTAVDIEFTSGSTDILGHIRPGTCREAKAAVPYAFTLVPVENEFAEASLVLPVAFERFASDAFALELEDMETCVGLAPVP